MSAGANVVPGNGEVTIRERADAVGAVQKSHQHEVAIGITRVDCQRHRLR